MVQRNIENRKDVSKIVKIYAQKSPLYESYMAVAWSPRFENCHMNGGAFFAKKRYNTIFTYLFLQILPPPIMWQFSYLSIFIGFSVHFPKSVLIVLSSLGYNFRCRAATVNLMVSLKSYGRRDSSEIKIKNCWWDYNFVFGTNFVLFFYIYNFWTFRES